MQQTNNTTATKRVLTDVAVATLWLAASTAQFFNKGGAVDGHRLG